MKSIETIRPWLVGEPSNRNGGYSHKLLKEDPSHRAAAIPGLCAFVRKAHEDALQRLRQLAGISLDPLATSTGDPAELYPHRLPMTVLKGCFGEIFAGLIAEHFMPFGEDGWEVPAYLFRTHAVAFEQLEASFQTGEDPHPVPGRTGDDCLAFRRNEQGEILNCLYCEAKCTADHDASLIADAHQKVSVSPVVNILQIIEVLQERGDETSSAWIEPLRRLRLKQTIPGYERRDLVSYICGRAPTSRKTWMCIERPHVNYTADRRLEAVEVHLNGVEELIKAVYHKAVWL